MKYTFTIAALAAFTAAQTIADLPTCSLSCVVTGVSGIGCSATDFECSCTKADQLTPAITPCVQSACSAADQAKVITVLEGICAAAGFPITVPEPTSAAPAPSSAPVESAAPTETAAESSVAPTIETSAPAPTATEPASSAYDFPSPTAEESCVVTTVTVTLTSSSAVAPYPTAPIGTGVPVVPSGTGSYTAPPPYFTGAASGMKVPAGIAGVLGFAALVL